jgi:hypothetical protein
MKTHNRKILGLLIFVILGLFLMYISIKHGEQLPVKLLGSILSLWLIYSAIHTYKREVR